MIYYLFVCVNENFNVVEAKAFKEFDSAKNYMNERYKKERDSIEKTEDSEIFDSALYENAANIYWVDNGDTFVYQMEITKIEI